MITLNEGKVIKIGCIYSNPKNIGGNGRGAVYLADGIAPTIVTMSGGGNKPFVIIMKRSKYEQNRKTNS